MHNIQSPRTDDAGIEAEIVAKGLTAPRVTIDDIEAAIRQEVYFTAGEGELGALVARAAKESEEGIAHVKAPEVIAGPLTLLTFCVLVLKNGFTVTGESACASPENFDAEIGRKIARVNAVNKVWPLLGYALKDRLNQ